MLTIKIDNKTAFLALHFLCYGMQLVCFTYVNALYLTSYPPSWLPYFFIGQALIDFSIAYFVIPLLSKNTLQHSVILQIIALALTVLFIFLIPFDFFFTVFIFSFFLMTAGLLFSVIAWSNALSVFNIIEFKAISNQITMAGTLGNITFSILTLLLISKFSPNVFVFLILILMLASTFFLYQLKPIPQIARHARHTGTPMQHPLYRKVFFSMFLLTICYTLVDFSLKYDLSLTRSMREIAAFMIGIMGVGNIIALLISYFLTKKILYHYGVSTLLMSLPIYWLVTGIIVILYPTVWTVALMAAGRFILYQSLFSVGRELTLNIMPNQIRIKGQFQLRSMSTPAATGVSAMALFFFKHYVNIPVIAFITICFSLFLIFYIRKINTSYIATLKEEVELKRYNLNNDLREHSPETIREVINTTLSGHDPNAIRFGLSLLASTQLPVLPNTLLNHLDSPFPDIRTQVIQHIEHFEMKEITPTLLSHLKEEKHPEVIWSLLNTLITLESPEAVSYAQHALKSTQPPVRAGSIYTLVKMGDAQQAKIGRLSFKEMLTDPSEEMRKWGARLLSFIYTSDFQKALIQLIRDDTSLVSNEAINTAARLTLSELIPVILQRVMKGGVSYQAEKALIEFGSASLPYLQEQIVLTKNQNLPQLAILIRILASIPNIEVDSMLTALGDDRVTKVRSLAAKESAYRAYHLVPSVKFCQDATALAMKEIKLVLFLRYLIKEYNEKYIISEINARKNLAWKRFLYWVAVFTDPHEIIGLMPSALSDNKAEQAAAIELLNNIVKNRTLTEMTINIFLDKPSDVSKDLFLHKEENLDDWLTTVTHYTPSVKLGGNMDNIQKVFALRNTEIFSHLPSETLLIIAEETQAIDVLKGQRIFSEGEQPTGLYIVVSGAVEILKDDKVLTQLKEHDFFGELGLIDNSPRSATAIAKTDGVLLFLEKHTFDRVTDDVPEVLRAVMQVVMRYLRSYMSKSQTIQKE